MRAATIRRGVLLACGALGGGACSLPWDTYEPVDEAAPPRDGDATTSDITPPDDVATDAGTDSSSDGPLPHDGGDACRPDCTGVPCGADNGCGVTCEYLSGCLTAAVLPDVLYTALPASAGCTAAIGASHDCDVAIHAYCVARGWRTGFGPVDAVRTDDRLSIACVGSPSRYLLAPFADVRARQPPCDGGDPHSTVCLTASSRYCNSTDGGLGGYGIVEFDLAGGTAGVACATYTASRAAFVAVAASDLATQGCPDLTQRTAACSYAAHAVCLLQPGGWVTGIGPTEYTTGADGGVRATLLCFR